jgi:hypothetical protein
MKKLLILIGLMLFALQAFALYVLENDGSTILLSNKTVWRVDRDDRMEALQVGKLTEVSIRKTPYSNLKKEYLMKMEGRELKVYFVKHKK